MVRQRIVAVSVVAAFIVLAGCSGPVSIGQPFPITGSSWVEAKINSCMPVAGRINVAIDVTAGANPSYILVGISDDATGYERPTFWPPASGFHWEETGTIRHAAGACIAIQIDLNEASPGNPAWAASDRSFHYTVSIVP